MQRPRTNNIIDIWCKVLIKVQETLIKVLADLLKYLEENHSLIYTYEEDCFKKSYHWLFNIQSIKLSSFSKNDFIIQEREEIFKKNLTLFFGARLLSPPHVV